VIPKSLLFSHIYFSTSNLDGEGGWHSHEHTELLVREFELGTLWDEYGLVGDLVVCFHAFSFFFTKIPILIAIYK
jgi:hypothetical protein